MRARPTRRSPRGPKPGKSRQSPRSPGSAIRPEFILEFRFAFGLEPRFFAPLDDQLLGEHAVGGDWAKRPLSRLTTSSRRSRTSLPSSTRATSSCPGSMSNSARSAAGMTILPCAPTRTFSLSFVSISRLWHRHFNLAMLTHYSAFFPRECHSKGHTGRFFWLRIAALLTSLPDDANAIEHIRIMSAPEKVGDP